MRRKAKRKYTRRVRQSEFEVAVNGLLDQVAAAREKVVKAQEELDAVMAQAEMASKRLALIACPVPEKQSAPAVRIERPSGGFVTGRPCCGSKGARHRAGCESKPPATDGRYDCCGRKVNSGHKPTCENASSNSHKAGRDEAVAKALESADLYVCCDCDFKGRFREKPESCPECKKGIMIQGKDL